MQMPSLYYFKCKKLFFKQLEKLSDLDLIEFSSNKNHKYMKKEVMTIY